MHESNVSSKTDSHRLDEIIDRLDKLYDAQMSMFVQISRVYDIMAAKVVGETAEGFTEILTDHQNGIIQTSVPTVKSFGAGYEDDNA